MPQASSPSSFTSSVIGVIATLWASVALAAPINIPIDADLESLLGDRDVVFLARELDGDRTHALNPERINERQTPNSTFKIPNFLIALDTGVITDAHQIKDWNEAYRPPSDFWPESWKQPQSLMTAFQRSSVWFFRDIALEVGGERYRAELTRLDYGNAEAADNSDLFWLDGTLRISPVEQVNYLARLLQGEFDTPPEHLALLEQASLLKEIDNCQLHGKTGAGPATENFDGPFNGWLVGWVRCPDQAPTVFALWTHGPSFAAISRFRQQAAVALLQRTGAFDHQQETPMTTHTHHTIDYIEIPVTDLTEAKRFYGEAFGWAFNDYGDDRGVQYVGIRKHPDIPEQEVGGFSPVETIQQGSILVILYSEDLETSLEQVRQAGGQITTEPFSFPGGRRFHFKDPAGNELAVWSSE